MGSLFRRVLIAVLLFAALEIPAQVTVRSSSLELQVPGAPGGVSIRILSTGEVWHSSPISAADQGYPEALRALLLSPFHLTYTDADMKITYTADERTPGITRSLTAVEGGGRVDYRIPCVVEDRQTGSVKYRGELGFSLIYRVEGSELEVRIPDVSIVESGGFLLVTLQLLPFLGSGGSDGAGGVVSLVAPDGGGLEIATRGSSRSTGGALSFQAYGEGSYEFPLRRTSFGLLLPAEIRMMHQRLAVAPEVSPLPVFALRRAASAVVGLVTEGDAYATVTVATTGHIVDFDRAGVELEYRSPYVTYLSRTTQVERYPLERARGDRTVRYTFVAGATEWPDLARAASVLVTRGRVDTTARPLPAVSLRVVMGARARKLVGYEMAVATTFLQVREIVESARAAGISGMSLTLVGWETGGYGGDAPRKFPPDRAFGGERGLEELAAYCRSVGVPLFLEVDELTASRGARGFRVGRDAQKEPSGIPITDGEGLYLVSPRVVLSRYAPEDIRAATKLGVDGLAFRGLGTYLAADAAQDRSADRGEAAGVWREVFSLARSAGLLVTVDGAAGWTLGSVDGQYQFPLTASGYVTARNSIPFQAALARPLASIIGRPANLEPDMVEAILRAVSQGVRPCLELTWSDPSVLRDTTLGYLYRSRSAEILPEVAELLGKVSREMGHLDGRALLDVEAAREGVTVSRYEGGSTLIVNTTREPVTVAGQTVRPRDFVVAPSWR